MVSANTSNQNKKAHLDIAKWAFFWVSLQDVGSNRYWIVFK
jgi:hypothetical protein